MRQVIAKHRFVIIIDFVVVVFHHFTQAKRLNSSESNSHSILLHDVYVCVCVVLHGIEDVCLNFKHIPNSS